MSAACVRLRASPVSLSGVALAPPSDRPARQDRSLADEHGPRSKHGWRHLASSGRPCDLPRTASNEAETPSDREERPPVEVSRARSRPTFVGGASPRDHPFGRWRESFIPTRSARTPLVVGPRHRRLETPTVPGADPVGKNAHDDLTARAPPPRRVRARGLSTTRLRGAAGRALRC